MKGTNKPVKVINKGGPLGFVFFAAWFGAFIYFVQHSHGFGGLLLAILKSFVWPAFVLHRLMVFLQV